MRLFSGENLMQSSGKQLCLHSCLNKALLLSRYSLQTSSTRGSRFAPPPEGIITRMENCQSPIWLLCVVEVLLGGIPVCGGQYLGSWSSSLPQQVVRTDFLCQCVLHCTWIILFTLGSFALYTWGEKKSRLHLPIKLWFLRGPCVLPESVTLTRAESGCF